MDGVTNRITSRVDRSARGRRIGGELRATAADAVDADQAVTSAQTPAATQSRQSDHPDAELDPRSGAATDPLQTALVEAMQAGLSEGPRSEAARLRRNAYADTSRPPPLAAHDEVTV